MHRKRGRMAKRKSNALRWVIGIVIIAIIIIGAVLIFTPKETGVIKIGFIAPLSGDTAVYGTASRGGAEIAIEEINNAGGINGKKLEVIYEDGKCNGKDSATAANKLISIDNVFVIFGTVCSAETLAIAPIAESNKIILLSAASSAPSITEAGDYIFRTWPSDSLQGKEMAEYVYGKGIKKVAIINMNSDYPVGLANVFKETFVQLGGEVLISEIYEPTAKDFRTQLTKIKAKNPEAIYIIPYTAEAGILVKQIKELGIKAELYGPETFHSQEVINTAGNASEGIVYMMPKFDETEQLTKELLDKYKTKYGKDSPFAVVTANTYDGVYIIAEGLKKGVSSDAVKGYLYTLKDYPGTAGVLTIDQNGDALKDFQFMIIKEGKLQEFS